MASVVRRCLGILGLCVLLAVTMLGLGTLIPRPISVSDAARLQSDNNPATRRILVLSNPIHTDIALPADPDVLRALSFVSDAGLNLDYPGVHWVVVGWGSRAFYIETPTWADLKPGPVLKALTWDRSVMHVRRVGQIAEGLEAVRAVDLSNAAFERLAEEIVASFLTMGPGEPIAISNASYDEHDIFFPGVDGFNAFVGCNTWTARILRIAGLRTGVWTPLPVTLTWSLDAHNAL